MIRFSIMIMTLLSAVALIAPLLVYAQDAAKTSTPLRTHSIYMPYIDQDLQNRWFDFGGDTVINTNKHIRLTYDRASQMGWLWSRLPLTAPNFQIEFEFKISGEGSTLYGDGFAMWLTKDRAKPGPVFGSVDYFEGLGIFFDTYPNAKHPYGFPRVMAMIGDGKSSYDLPNDGKVNEVAACTASVRDKEIATKARLTVYRGNYLELHLQYKAWDEWTHCFAIPNIELPRMAFLGFSALTGEVSDNHDIISVTTQSLASIPPRKASTNPQTNGKRYSSSGNSGLWTFFMVMVKLILFGAVVFVGVIIYRIYKSKSKGFGKASARF